MGSMDGDRTINDIVKDQIAAQVKVIKPQPGDIIVAKLGIVDMGEGMPPWIPNVDELVMAREDLELVLPEGVEALVYHMGLEFEVLSDLSEADRVLVTQP
jgi:hypothetical protein